MSIDPDGAILARAAHDKGPLLAFGCVADTYPAAEALLRRAPGKLTGDRDWPTSAAFADLDGDGDLDLYVCHYLSYDPSNPKRCDDPVSPGKNDCMPRDFPSLGDHVFRNDNGKFVDVTKLAGFVDPDGRGLGVVAAHLDDDDKIDLYVANDMSANYLFRNLGSFRFEETGEASGAAAGADGLYKSGMGIACAPAAQQRAGNNTRT